MHHQRQLDETLRVQVLHGTRDGHDVWTESLQPAAGFAAREAGSLRSYWRLFRIQLRIESALPTIEITTKPMMKPCTYGDCAMPIILRP